ncbi:MAG: RNA polymerase factor sigma-54 [Myxococcota bacterium]|nr:RNA polymerase factor sigma-54 [Myxococcota bacterium]
MDLSIGLKLAMTQKLVMTQQLQQAIKLLQLNQQEMAASIDAELERNPTLEEVPGTEEAPLSEAEMAVMDKVAAQARETTEQSNGAQENEIDWKKFLEEHIASNAFKTGASAGYYDDLPPIENTLSASTGLVEHLASQVSLINCTQGERHALMVMILNLDEHGWLDCDLDFVAEESGSDMDDIEGALMIIHALDPIGCGSRDLKECMLIQIKDRWPEDPFFPDLVTNHLSHIEERNYSTIARDMDMDMEDVLEYHKMLQTLDPWPGRAFAEPEDQYITPDIEVVKVGGEWQILQNEDGMPRLRLSSKYQEMFKEGSDKGDKEFVEKRLRAAKFLIESIYKRQRTIYRVMEAILRRQTGFFEHGTESLRPMVLADIADEIGVHESTVSRATTNKYVQCPHGIFELKFFFNAGIRQTTGGELASEAVKHKIRKLIADENLHKPYSDSALARLLKEDNIKIARRTVAKYRESMGILPSTQRKKLF